MEEAENMLSLEFVTKIMGEGDKERFKGVKPEDMLALLKAFVETSVECARNRRTAHLKSLYKMLEECISNVEALEEAADHEDWVLPPEHIEIVTRVYSIMTLVVFWGFVDNMEVEEEEELKKRLDILGVAWKRLFGKIAKTRPKLKRRCTKSVKDERRLAENWSDLFLGEVEPVFTPEYAQSYMAFAGDLKANAEGL